MRRPISPIAIAAAALAVLGTAAVPAAAVAPGEPAPALSLPGADGQTVALDKLRGRVVYVDFWASWCGPCKRSFPWMNELQARYGDKGFTVVAVNVDRKRDDAARFLAQTPGRFPIVYDGAGATPTAWGVKGMPSSYLVDAAGTVVAVETGYKDEQKAAIEERIRALVGAR